MKKLKIESLAGNWHFLAVLLILIILSIKYPYLIIIAFSYFIFMLKRCPKSIWILIIVILLFLSYLQYVEFADIAYEYDGLIVEKDDNNYTVLTIDNCYLIYSKNELHLGDYGHFKTKDFIYNNPSPFDYETYLKNKNINAYQSLISFEIINNYFVLTKMQNYLLEIIPDTKIKPYISTLILGKNILDKDLIENTEKIGISHILAISGMHITILLFLFNFLIDKLFYFSFQKEKIKTIFLLLFIIITNFNISVMRSALMIILSVIFKKTLLTRLDYWSLICIGFLIIHPKYLFLPAFYFSFLMSFIMIIMFQKKNNIILSTFITSFVLFFVGLPLTINLNYEINFLTSLFSFLFILYFQLILFPTVIISLLIPFLTNYFYFVFFIFEKSVNMLASFDDFILITGHQNIIIVLLLMFLSFLILKNYQKIIKLTSFLGIYSLIFMIFCLKMITINNVNIVMYNVGQGDSILVKSPNKNILIDAYGHIDDYLKYDGIRKIDYVFFSHGDDDHIGSFEEVYKIYKSDNIFINKNTISANLKALKEKYNGSFIDNNFYYEDQYMKIKILNDDYQYDEENNNSLIMEMEIYNIIFLLTGDMELELEQNIINKVNSVDILKVAHHGSKTSCQKSFLDKIKPQISLISVGKNNKYGHPNNQYLLDNYLTYRTDIEKTIYININKYGKINKRSALYYF